MKDRSGRVTNSIADVFVLRRWCGVSVIACGAVSRPHGSSEFWIGIRDIVAMERTIIKARLVKMSVTGNGHADFVWCVPYS